MVTIVDFETRQNAKGEDFNVLILRGEIEMVRSQETGQIYATAPETSITCTFDEATCEQLTGQELPGQIEKVESEPYEYEIPETGEKVILSHTYQYNPDADSLEGQVFEDGMEAA